MTQNRNPYILTTSSNLLGICIVLITGIHFSNMQNRTIVDEIALFAAFIFLGSCILSYLSIRDARDTVLLEHIADYLFLLGIGILFIAMAVLTLID